MNSLPYVRCVGIGTAVYQNELKKAYDCRMICVLEGEGNIQIDSRTYDTRPNRIYIIPPATAYCVRSSREQKIAVINFDTTYENSDISDPVLCVDAGNFKENEIIKCQPVKFLENAEYKVSVSDLELFDELYQTYLREDMEAEFKSFLLSSKLVYIISKFLDNEKKPDAVSSVVYKYIIDNACEKMSVESVAAKFNYSASYIEKILRRDYGISFKQLVIETRLKKALWLLENTSLSCAEISSQLGFYSSQHFTQTFKKKYNEKPTHFR